MDATSRVYSAAATPAGLALRQGNAADVRRALQAARRRTLALADDWFAALGAVRPHIPYAPGLNPPLWELGHIAWFQEWWIARNPQRGRGTACDPDIPRAASLLPQADSWYDSSRVAHRTRWELPLPDGPATLDYLARTLQRTLLLLDDLPPDAGAEALYFYRLAALHEEMHAEASVYMARTLGIPVFAPQPPQLAPETRELELPAQSFRLGSGGEPGFAFDNELPGLDVEIGGCRIDAQPVSWARYWAFVDAGGYEEPRWWSEAGWAWRLGQGDAAWPERPVHWWQPALHLSAFEAEAWCRWARRRLPTEAEWECAASTLPGFVWGQAWEWTASPFLPYPGFVAHPYRDYSQPWFESRRVLRGACAATSPVLASVRLRNFFEPQRRDIFAGFRTVSPG